ncbi:unnamed protein product [Anisakis simplex]|uniref:glutathione transferase n=1 Tax=Anisakis simplex TaxID=6269 RepID=A0A0M3J5J0_ANISI|nr:unnamed protein product [Anisakis simplex]
MPTYKLTYFDIRGLGEGARLIFHQAGVQFEDHRVKKEDWPALKPTTPFGQMPLLDVDGDVIAQSAAIYRYLGRQFGLAGKTPMEEAQVDSIYDEWKDFAAEAKPYFMVYAAFERRIKLSVRHLQAKIEKEVLIPARDKHMPLITKFLEKSGSNFLVGNSLTWADIVISDQLLTYQNWVPGFLEPYPLLLKFVENVRSQPNIKKWMEERPQSPF